jgi:hypothetical protein
MICIRFQRRSVNILLLITTKQTMIIPSLPQAFVHYRKFPL